MKNSLGMGAFVLIVSGFICKLFGAMFRLPLTNILGIEGIGVFQMVMALYSLTLVLITGGVTTSLSQLTSSARSRGEESKIGGYAKWALLFTFGAGVVLGVLFLLFARSIASAQGATAGMEAYRLLIFLLPLGALIGVFRGIIQGYENMTPTAVSQIIEQITKFAFGLLFAYFFGQRGAAQGVYGAFLGITVSEVLALLYLGFYMLRKFRMTIFSQNSGRREFLHAVIPLSIGGAVLPLTHAVDSLIIVSLLAKAGLSAQEATSLFGLQTGVVGAILNFPLIISLSISMALLPKISFLFGKQDIEKQRNTISTSFSLMWFFLVPMVVGLVALSKLLYPIIYPAAINGFLQEAVGLTIVGGVSIVLSGIMQFLLSLLQARGKFVYSLIITALGGILKVIVVVFTAGLPEINIYALPLSNIALSLVICIGALLKLGDIVKISIYNVLLPLVASFVMYLVIYIFQQTITFKPIITIMLSVFIGGAIYLTLNIPLISGIIKKIFVKYSPKEEKNE